MTRPVPALVPLLCAAVIAAAACSSSSHTSTGAGTTSTTAGAHTAATWSKPACHETRPAPPHAVAVAGSAADRDITSFDGTRIRAHWFPNPNASASAPAPTVLKGPGWSIAGDTDTKTKGQGLFGDTNIADLWAAGYNVLTWDPRGFGKSAGTVSVDAPNIEGRDTQVLLDWVAAQPGVQLDAPGDARVGMVGGSYGGGIQLVLAAIDCRVDAIVPTIAWHSLATSLFKAETPKQGWANQLYGFAQGKQLDPHIVSSHASMNATGTVSAADAAWFTARGPGDLVKQINIPTLFVQGTVDTLFTLDEAATNSAILQARGVPTAMLWYCGGHGVCLTKGGDATASGRATTAWLDHYLKGTTTTPLPPAFTTVDQNGANLTGDAYPPAAGTPITAHGSGALALAPTNVETPKPQPGAPAAALGAIVGSITPGHATNGLDVPVTAPQAALVLGAPQLTLTYSGTTPPGERPTRVFAQLVDPTTNLVLGNQITPIAVQLDGTSHTTTVPLEMVAFSATPGAKLTLQLTATTNAYVQPRLGGKIAFSSIALSLPTATGMHAQ